MIFHKMSLYLGTRGISKLRFIFYKNFCRSKHKKVTGCPRYRWNFAIVVTAEMLAESIIGGIFEFERYYSFFPTVVVAGTTFNAAIAFDAPAPKRAEIRHVARCAH